MCPGLDPSNLFPKVFVSNEPLPRTKEERSQSLNNTESLIRSVKAGFPLASNILFAISYLAATFSYFPIQDVLTKAKHLQFVSGVKLCMIRIWMKFYLNVTLA